jgi:hypothetical protein
MSFPVSATEESARGASAGRISLREKLLREDTFGIPRVRLYFANPHDHASLVHYHAMAEIERFGLVLEQIAGS